MLTKSYQKKQAAEGGDELINYTESKNYEKGLRLGGFLVLLVAVLESKEEAMEKEKCSVKGPRYPLGG